MAWHRFSVRRRCAASAAIAVSGNAAAGVSAAIRAHPGPAATTTKTIFPVQVFFWFSFFLFFSFFTPIYFSVSPPAPLFVIKPPPVHPSAPHAARFSVLPPLHLNFFRTRPAVTSRYIYCFIHALCLGIYLFIFFKITRTIDTFIVNPVRDSSQTASVKYLSTMYSVFLCIYGTMRINRWY